MEQLLDCWKKKDVVGLRRALIAQAGLLGRSLRKALLWMLVVMNLGFSLGFGLYYGLATGLRYDSLLSPETQAVYILPITAQEETGEEPRG